MSQTRDIWKHIQFPLQENISLEKRTSDNLIKKADSLNRIFFFFFLSSVTTEAYILVKAQRKVVCSLRDFPGTAQIRLTSLWDHRPRREGGRGGWSDLGAVLSSLGIKIAILHVLFPG